MKATAYLSRVSMCLAMVEATDVSGVGIRLDALMASCVTRLLCLKPTGGQVHLVGNGGSAAVVAHAQNDFVKAAKIPARVYQDIPLLTAYANDCGYAETFAESLSLWIGPSDLLIAVSSSGESPNILNAVKVARNQGAAVITCSGFAPMNTLRGLGDSNFYVPFQDYGCVELTHAALLHYLTDEVAHVG